MNWDKNHSRLVFVTQYLKGEKRIMFGISKQRLFLYCALFFMASFAVAMGNTQYVTYLAGVGYSVAERGIIIAAFSTLLIFMQIYIGRIVDKTKKIRLIFIICVLSFAISLVSLYQIATKIYLLQIILILLAGSLGSSSLNLQPTLLLAYGKKEAEAFSFVRSFASLGWALSSLLIGPVLTYFNFRVLGVLALLAGIVTCAILYVLPEPTLASKEHTKVNRDDIRLLLTNKNYILVILALFFLTVTSSAGGTIVTDKMLELGGTAQDISFRWALAAFVEIPIFIVGSRIIQSFGHYKMLIAGALALILQYILFMVAGNNMLIMIATALQMFTIPFMNLPGSLLVNEYAPEKVKSTALMIAVSVYGGVPTVIVPFFGGMITTTFGVNATLTVAIISAVIGLGISYYLYTLNRQPKAETVF